MSIPISGSGGATPTPDRSVRNPPAKHRDTARAKDFVMVLAGQDGITTARRAFADQPAQGILRPTQAARFEDGFDIEAAGQRFNVVPNTAGRAVAFDARPVVGPAAIAPGFGDEAQAPLAQVAAASGPAGRLDARNAVTGVVTAMDMLGGGAIAMRAPQTGHRPASGIAAPLALAGSRQVAAPSAPSPSASVPSPDAPDAAFDPLIDPPAESDAHSPLGRSLEWQAQHGGRSQMLASLLASAEDYRVFVRGVMLDPREERALARSLRAVLREFGFPDRPVIVAAAGRDR